MTAADFFLRCFAEMLFRVFVAVIEHVAASQYAADVVDALHARFKRMGAWAGAWSALRALPTALASRRPSLTKVIIAVGSFAADLVVLPFHLAGAVLFVPTAFCFYYDLVAVPAFAMLSTHAQHSSLTAAIVALTAMVGVVAISWAAAGRARWMLVVFALSVMAIAPPVVGRLHDAGLPPFGTVAAGALVVVGTIGVAFMLIVMGRHATTHLPSSCGTGAACMFVIIVHWQMLEKHGVGHSPSDIASAVGFRIGILVLAIVALGVWTAAWLRIGTAWQEWVAWDDWTHENRPYVYMPPNAREVEEHERRVKAFEKRRVEAVAAFYGSRSRPDRQATLTGVSKRRASDAVRLRS